MGAQADNEFQKRIASWKDAFADDTTGIHRTIDDLIFKYASFMMATRVVFLANQRSGGPINQILFDMIAEGFWHSLLLGIRRLLDDAPLKGNRGVYSIRAVLSDIRASRSRLTRKAYVEWLRDCRYDLDVLRAENWKRLEEAKGKPVWGDRALPLSEFSHGDFDFLSGTDASTRTPADLIRDEVFDKFEARLSKLDSISAHVSTHVAHAGTRESRVGKGLEKFDLRDAREALKELKQVADLVGKWFANEGGSPLATYIGDQYEGLDQPLVPTEEIPQLEEQWDKVRRDIDQWEIKPEEL